jgi:hypothetical protein
MKTDPPKTDADSTPYPRSIILITPSSSLQGPVMKTWRQPEGCWLEFLALPLLKHPLCWSAQPVIV